MKCLIIVVIEAVALAAFAAGSPLGDYHKPFDGGRCEISWDATTNHLPASVQVWSVNPTRFSPTVVSNLLTLAELKSSQVKRVDQGGVFADKDVLFYADKTETRCLNLIPSQGFIVISKIGVLARIPREFPSNVPDKKTALKLTLDILEKVGIDQSELMTNSAGNILYGTTETEVLQKDKSTGQIKTNIVARDIFLTRQINGIAVTGNKGISAKFGNEGKLADLSIVWRAVKPERDCAVPDAAGFINRIKAGRALIHETQAGKLYRKITIKKVSLYYWESEGSQFQTTIYPFAVLEAETDLPAKDSTVKLYVQFASE